MPARAAAQTWLLVFWTAEERDALMDRLQPRWDHCFVNHVEDVTP